MYKTPVTLTLLAISLLCGCTEDYEPLTISIHNNQFIAKGVIDESTPDTISKAISATPSIRVLVLQAVPGSVDDEANLIAARMVRRAGLSTVVPADGVVASGGTDLFLAGKERKIAPGACVGVHTWGEPSYTGLKPGSEFPKDAPQHDLYLSYYQEMAIPADFYWFTLQAAPLDDAYFMNAKEMNQFNMATYILSEQNQEIASHQYERCILRLIEAIE